MQSKSEEYINKLSLIKHPEGGFFRETYRSGLTMEMESGCKRNVSTSIYYLLNENAFSAFHKIKSDETWHYYDGDCVLEILVFHEGKLQILKLGLDIENGELPQHVVPAGQWFAARLSTKKGFVLAGCTVAPGFDFVDFEMARREELEVAFPQFKEIIEQYCIE